MAFLFEFKYTMFVIAMLNVKSDNEFKYIIPVVLVGECWMIMSNLEFKYLIPIARVVEC